MPHDPMDNCGKLCGRANYISWHFELKQYLEAINLGGTLGIVQVDERQRMVAMEMILFYMEPSERTLVRGCQTPLQVFNRLQAIYYPNTIVNHAGIRGQIANVENDEVGKMEQFLFQICFHFRELRLSGVNVNHQEIMSTLLYKLPTRYGYLIPRLNACRTVQQFANLLEKADREMVWARALERYHLEMAQINASGYYNPVAIQSAS